LFSSARVLINDRTIRATEKTHGVQRGFLADSKGTLDKTVESLNADVEGFRQRLDDAMSLKNQAIEEREARITCMAEGAHRKQQQLEAIQTNLNEESARLRTSTTTVESQGKRIEKLKLDLDTSKNANDTLLAEKRTAEEKLLTSENATKQVSEQLKKAMAKTRQLESDLESGTKQLQNSSETHEKRVEELSLEVQLQIQKNDRLTGDVRELKFQHEGDLRASKNSHSDELF
jgi:chromosome segregation ATPase